MSARRRSAPKPSSLRIRMYQVGFGDAFLLTFRYSRALEDGRKERHLLMDYGSTSSPPGGSTLNAVADDIETVVGDGRLDVIAVSHRHKDHLSGFGAKARTGQIGKLKPRLVVRSWTEDPEAPADATGPSRFGPSSGGFARALVNGQSLMESIATALTEIAESREGRRYLGGHRGELLKAAQDEISNKAAVDALAAWGQAEGADAEFLHYGMKSKIEDVIPGITVRVIGPPTMEQSPTVGGHKSSDPEYWTLHQRHLRRALKSTGLDTKPLSDLGLAGGDRIDPGRVRWLVERMRDQNVAHLARIVRQLDDALNNTSLILLIDAGDKRMLFPGDAQIENWTYALRESQEADGFDFESVLKLLGDVDFYKVGHHGSRNATPRTLFNQWTKAKNLERPMVSMMCTESGVHGKSERTAVPRATLREALARRSRLYTTDGLEPQKQLFIDVEAKLRGGHPFAYAGPGDPAGGLFVPHLQT